MDMKYEWMRCADCAAGFIFSIASTGVERKFFPVLAALKMSRGDSRTKGVCVVDWRCGERGAAIEEKGEAYGSTWAVSFAKNAGRVLEDGLSACRMSVSSGNHLFSSGDAPTRRFNRTYECPKKDTARQRFLDCVLMFDSHGSLVEDKAVGGPKKPLLPNLSKI